MEIPECSLSSTKLNIMNAIHSIRLNKKKRRKRKANYDNILNFLKQIQENVDIKTVKFAIKELIDDNKICSNGQVGKEYYFLSLQLDKNKIYKQTIWKIHSLLLTRNITKSLKTRFPNQRNVLIQQLAHT